MQLENDMKNNSPECVVLRPAQAAAYIGVSRRKIDDLSEKDPTFPRKIYYSARLVVFRRESLDAWLKQKEQNAA